MQLKNPRLYQVPLSVQSQFTSLLLNLNFPGYVSLPSHPVLWACEVVPKGLIQHEKGRNWDLLTSDHSTCEGQGVFQVGQRQGLGEGSRLDSGSWLSPRWEGSHLHPLCAALSSFPHLLALSKRVFLHHGHHSKRSPDGEDALTTL